MKQLFYFFLVCTSLSLTTNLNASTSWAQSTLKKMSLDEKIGQLFMIAAYVDSDFAASEIGNAHILQDIDAYITQYHVGGLAYVGPSTCLKQIELTNHYQKISKYPLLIAQDLEWGLSMRIKDGMRFPKNMTLGAIKESHQIYEMGKEIGNQAKLIGVHMNLSPVLDVNNEPENVAINVRSFGSEPALVAKHGVAMILGLQDAGLIASAKHFPGLGDISVDPHLGLPYSNQNRKRLEAIELYPFVQAIKAGVLSIQTEHLVIPALDPENTPASLSHRIVTDLLKKELGFEGLVLSGALRMKALTENFSEKEIILKAFLAGSDMLLMPQNLKSAFQTIKTAIEEEQITEKDVEKRVLKILQLKEKINLHRQNTIKIPAMEELHSASGIALKKLLYQKAITLLRKGQHCLPLSSHKKGSIAYVQIGEDPSSHFLDTLRKQLPLETFIFSLQSRENDLQQMQELLKKMETYSLLLLTIYPADPRRIEQIRLLSDKQQKEKLKHFRVHGITDSLVQLITLLHPYEKKTIVTYFGNPFGLHFFDSYSTLLMAYEADPDAQEASAHFLLKD